MGKRFFPEPGLFGPSGGWTFRCTWGLNVIYTPMEFTLQSYPCQVCGSQERRQRYEIRGFQLVQCKDCGLEYIDPRIANEQVYELYRDDYFHRQADGYEDYELTENLRRKTFSRWFEQIKPFLKIPNGSALDIGCAAGYFLDVLKEYGWEAHGIELDNRMHQQVTKRGFQVSDKPLEYYGADNQFDLITLFDVIEHLPHVNDDIDRLARLLSPNGIIVLVTPNSGSFQHRLFGKHWFQYKPKEHIQYFSPDTLLRIIERHGLRLVHTSQSGQFADCSFLYNRLKRYGFPVAASFFNFVTGHLRLKQASWYTDTGSMFAVIEKPGDE